MQRFSIVLRSFLLLNILLGLGYPLLTVYLGKMCFPHQANGSLIKQGEKIIGSSLIAQEFTAAQYFHSRFSAIDYDGATSGSRKLTPTTEHFYAKTQKHIHEIRLANNISYDIALPADIGLASASGLDPHISLANALLQLPRVAVARNLNPSALETVVTKHVERDFIGIWGQAVINVLLLNLALDKLKF